MTETAADTFPGWYPDPKGEADQRFWNGRDWTDQTRTAVPAAEFVPEASEKSNGSGGSNGNGSDEGTGKVRIFGGRTAKSDVPDAALLTESTAKAEVVEEVATTPAPIPESAVEPKKTEPVKVEPVKVEPVKTEPKHEKPKEDATSLFGDRSQTARGKSVDRPAKGEAASLTDSVDNDPQLQRVAKAESPRVLYNTEPPKSLGPKILAILLPALLVGGLIGWLIGRSSDDGGATADLPSTTEAVASSEATSSEEAAVETTVPTSQPDDEVAAAGQDVDELSIELDEARAQVDALTVERDNALEHNEILQTWFTPQVRSNAESSWNSEVQRACDAEAEPTIENTNYTRRMELMGTAADLVTAALVCRAAG